ncbi:hypothetical protein SRABI03_01827 [Microbacterium foliorum]|nr:hypothetical protein SRABI03_01827 [Microbacterium foliorum]
MAAQGAEKHAGAVDHVDAVSLLLQMHGDRRAHRHRCFEGRVGRSPRPCPPRCAAVEDDERVRARFLLLLPHHQLPAMCGGAPVDAAHRVPGDVPARREVVAPLSQPARRGLRRAAGSAHLDRERGESEHLRDDRHAAGLAEGLLALGESERIHGPQHEGADRPHASADARDRIAELTGLGRVLARGVACHRIRQDVAPQASRHTRRDAHRDAGGLGDGQQVGRYLPGHRAGATRQPHREHRERRHGEEQHADVQEDRRADQVGGDQASETGEERGRAPQRERSTTRHGGGDQERAATGTRTRSTI